MLLTEVVARARIVVLLERRVQTRVDPHLQCGESCNPSQSADSHLREGKIANEILTIRMSRSGQMRSGSSLFITSSSDIPLNRLCFLRGFFSFFPSSPSPSIFMSRSSPSAMTSLPSPSPSSSKDISLKSPLKKSTNYTYFQKKELTFSNLPSASAWLAPLGQEVVAGILASAASWVSLPLVQSEASASHGNPSG